VGDYLADAESRWDGYPVGQQDWMLQPISAGYALLDDSKGLDRTYDKFYAVADAHVESSGRIKYGYNRTRGLFYSLHAIKALTNVAEIARHHGKDLWNWDDGEGGGGALRRALDYHVPYMLDASKWPYEEVGPWNSNYKSNAAIPYEMGYSQWKDSDYLNVVNRVGRPTNGIYIQEDGTLTHANLFSDISGALPVELMGFNAWLENSRIFLHWQTASETGNTGFAVERRWRGSSSFSQIGFVPGMGTTTEIYTYQFVDNEIPSDAEKLIYRLKQVDTDGTFDYSREVEVIPNFSSQAVLQGSVPNPFSEQTTIHYEIPRAMYVQLDIFDVQGRLVVNLVGERQQAGPKRIVFNGNGLTSGVYFLRLHVKGKTQIRSINLVR